jgi:predicted porin
MSIKNWTTVISTSIAVSTLILCPAAAQAVEASISGQVNRLIMHVNNGNESAVVHADNSVSGTRWRFAGQGDLSNDLTAGLLYETQLQSNPSNRITANSLDSDGAGGNLGGGDNFSTRQSNVWIKGNFGKVTIGQGSGAADGSAEVDESGTTVIQYSGASADLLGGMEFGNSGVTVNAVRSNFDGLSRNDNIRYDAAINDFALAGSLGNGSKIEASARYQLDNLKLMVALWDEKDSGAGNSGRAVSASWWRDDGLNLTGAYGGDNRNGSPNNIYLKVGIKRGEDAYAIDWSQTSDLGPGDAESFSIAWVRSMMQGVEVYASYRVESLDGVSGADDISALAGGMRVKF